MAHRSYRSPDGQWALVVEMDEKSWLPCRLVPFGGGSTGKPAGPVPAQCTDAAGGLWMADLETGQRQQLLTDFQIVHYSISADGQRVVFASVDEQGRNPVWLSFLNGQLPPRQVSTMDADAAFFGAPGEVLVAGQKDFHVYRVKDDGSELQKADVGRDTGATSALRQPTGARRA